MSHNRLKEVAGTLTRASLRAPDTRKLVLHRLIAERDRLKTSDPGLAGCLHAAAFLVRAGGELDGELAEHLQRMTLNVVRLVGAVLKDREAAEETASGGDGGDAAHDERKLNDMALGDLLVQLGFLEARDVELAMQQRGERRLGEVLVELGKVAAEDVERAATLQKVLGRKDDTVEVVEESGEVGRVRIGDLLLRNGVVTRKQLDEALVHQEHTGCRLGEALVELKHASWAAISDAVLEQQRHGGSTRKAKDETVVELD